MIMKFYNFTIICLLAIFISCSSHQKTMEASAKKEQLKEFITKKQFEIVSNFAIPRASAAYSQVVNSGLLGVGNSSNTVNLSGNSNYLRMHGDSISIELPFFGDRQFGGGYGADSGISYDGLYTDYKETYDSDKESYTLSFQTSKATDNLQFTINMYASLRTTIFMNSTNRSSISYDGHVGKLPK